MSRIQQSAIFGVTPLSLLFGRACGLLDRLPIGIYDIDPQSALHGALHLGVSAFDSPQRLHNPQSPLQLAIIGNIETAHAFASLAAPPIALCLFSEEPTLLSPWFQAVPLDSTGALASSIPAVMPNLAFRLTASSPEEKKAGEEILAELSPTFTFSD